ncbi:formate--phosphoribosylaminoimidazolecarboxamide ligase family protein [Candidatus Peregrinibacteria bacterium]|nr:formate--phosphoribosylaminoimidazolecarboxamide ligase family protein [Candidatus Peregrinibacteria bacterium]
MISQKDIQHILKNYDTEKLTVGVLGGHSALDVCAGAKKLGLRTVAVCQKGRDAPYSKYFKTRDATDRAGITIGCIDDVILVDKFGDIVKPEVQERLRKLNTIFIHNRYFWVYCDFHKIETEFKVPIFGTRSLLKLEERDQPKNQYYLLEKAGIRIPKIFKKPQEIDRLVLVKVNEAARGYERAFFTAASVEEYREKSDALLAKKSITKESLEKAVIEEFIIGAPVNFNFFYSPFAGEVELLGTDTRRQTNLDGLLRLPAWSQMELAEKFDPKIIETGHYAVTVKESLLGKILELGERFVKATQKEHAPGIIGPFALQGAVVAEEGKEDIVIFDVSLRIPGSPGTRFTPYSGYLYGQDVSVGERVAMEIAEGVKQGRLAEILT